MEICSIEEHIVQNYNLKPITLSQTPRGSGNTFYIETNSEKYVAITNERPDFTRIYDKVEAALTKLGYVQARIIKNQLMTAQNVVLYSFLRGETYQAFTITHMKSAENTLSG